MNSECHHIEEWFLTITREPGVDDAGWAETLPVKDTRTRSFRPDRIVLRLRKNDDLPVIVAIQGDRIGNTRARSAEGGRANSRYVLGRDLPEFAEILVERARRAHNCGEGVVHPYD